MSELNYTTDKIQQTQVIMGPMMMVHKLEDILVEAFSSTLPVVALGKPGETFGVGRILVDEDSWQKTASELMQRASLLSALFASRIPLGNEPNYAEPLLQQNSIYHASQSGISDLEGA